MKWIMNCLTSLFSMEFKMKLSTAFKIAMVAIFAISILFGFIGTKLANDEIMENYYKVRDTYKVKPPVEQPKKEQPRVIDMD